MTVSSDVARIVHQTNSGVTSYAFPFKVFKASDIRVVLIAPVSLERRELALGTDYAVSGLGLESGSVNLTETGRFKAGSGLNLFIGRGMSFVQETDYRPHDLFPAETHEQALDILTMMCQELRELLSRAVLVSEGLEPPSYEELKELLLAATGAGREAWEALEKIREIINSAGLSAGSISIRQPLPGAVLRTQSEKNAEYLSLNDFGVQPGLEANPAKNDAAVKVAMAAMEHRGGGEIHAPDQFYVFNDTIYIPNGVHIIGQGVGHWDTVFHDRPKEWPGTNFIFRGAGAKKHGFYGITRQALAGGERPDTDGSGHVYKLTEFMNDDASGAARATPRLFSAAVAPKFWREGALTDYNYPRNWGLQNIRLVPWLGPDGIAGYSNRSHQSLGDEWDVGVLSLNSEFEYFHNVQVVGYWRMAALLKAQPGFTTWGQGERGLYSRVKLQGFRGLCLRGGDTVKITGVSDKAVSVKWSANHFWDRTGAFEIANKGRNYTYTGLEYDPASPQSLTFTGVTPNPVTNGVITGDTIRMPYRGSGVSGTIFKDCFVSSMAHVSGRSALELGSATPSMAFEISGFPIRGLEFTNTKFQNPSPAQEPCLGFLGECRDIFFRGGQFENGLVVATPHPNSQTWPAGAYAVNGSLNLRFYGLTWSGASKRLFTPRTYFDESETEQPSSLLTEMYHVRSVQEGKIGVIRKNTGKTLEIWDGDGTSLLEFAEASGKLIVKNGRGLEFQGGAGMVSSQSNQPLVLRTGTNSRLSCLASGSVVPGADDDQNLGTGSFRWNSIFATNGVIQTSDARQKDLLGGVDEAVLRAVGELKPHLFRFKGRDRIHVGFTAQELEAVFKKHGLKAEDFGLFCHDHWESQPEIKDADGNVIQGKIKAGDSYGLRYQEILLLQTLILSRKIEALEKWLPAMKDMKEH